MLEKLKSFLLNDQIFFAIIVVLVGIASFSLGRASVADLGQESAKVSTKAGAAVIMKNDVKTQVESKMAAPVKSEVSSSATLVGSKSGTKYHLTTCPGAKQIKEENKIYFTSVKEAEAAGYKPAANCPQLQ